MNNKIDGRQFDSFDWEKAAEQLTHASAATIPTGEAVAHADSHVDGHSDSHADGHGDAPIET